MILSNSLQRTRVSKKANAADAAAAALHSGATCGFWKICTWNRYCEVVRDKKDIEAKDKDEKDQNSLQEYNEIYNQHVTISRKSQN